jgi:hypothetical protein
MRIIIKHRAPRLHSSTTSRLLAAILRLAALLIPRDRRKALAQHAPRDEPAHELAARPHRGPHERERDDARDADADDVHREEGLLARGVQERVRCRAVSTAPRRRTGRTVEALGRVREVRDAEVRREAAERAREVRPRRRRAVREQHLRARERRV